MRLVPLLVQLDPEAKVGAQVDDTRALVEQPSGHPGRLPMRRTDEREIGTFDVGLTAELEIGTQPWQMRTRRLTGELL